MEVDAYSQQLITYYPTLFTKTLRIIMVLKLYGMAQSTCTKRVALILKEKEVPFEFHAVDVAKGEHKSADYVKKQPFGQVPYIVCSSPSIYLI